MVDNYKQWHAKLPFSLLGYRTTVRTSTGATHLLVYSTEAVIPSEVDIPSLRIIQEAELRDAEWIRSQYEQLALIDGKRMNAVCHSHLYQNIMARVPGASGLSRIEFELRIGLRKNAGASVLMQLHLRRIFRRCDAAEAAQGSQMRVWLGCWSVAGARIMLRVVSAEAVEELG
nr:uncharacterized protein LOC104121007 [Nicotiana tomentosiformis]